MGTPQVIVIVIWVLQLFCAILLHGEQREGKHNF